MIGGFNNGDFDLKLLLKYKQHWLNFFTFISIIGLTGHSGRVGKWGDKIK